MKSDEKTNGAVKMPVDPEEKQLALRNALAQIEKKFGKGSVMKLGDSAALKVDVISTGSLNLDIALGVGGLPRGRIIEIYGPESSGKTTLALHCIAQAQKAGGQVAFIDAEHALDPVYAAALGVDIDSLLISQPDSGEDALEITEQLIRSGAIDAIVVDSVAALVPRDEIEGSMGDAQMGKHARLMSQAMRKLAGITSTSNCILIFINQLREKMVQYGNPETTTGGRALKFYASVRLDVRRGDQIKSGGEVVGNKTRVKVVKNKVAPPFREAEFDILYGKGISREGEIIDAAIRLDILQKSGAWFSYQGNRLGQGRDNVKAAILADPALFAELDQAVRENMAKLVDGKPEADNGGSVKAVVKKTATEEPDSPPPTDIDISFDE